ncbi:MAG TPA: cupin domain-containing protein [bacterium]|nr:cupin domain-containing protein [bacterium]
MRNLVSGVLTLAVVGIVTLCTGAAWSQYSGALGAVGAKSTTVLQTSKTAIHQDFQYPRQDAEVTTLLVEIAPGGQTGRHLHPVPEVACVLDGTVTVAIDGQGEKVYKAGDCLVEAINTWHNGMNKGIRPVKILAVFVGEKGKANVVRPPQ